MPFDPRQFWLMAGLQGLGQGIANIGSNQPVQVPNYAGMALGLQQMQQQQAQLEQQAQRQAAWSRMFGGTDPSLGQHGGNIIWNPTPGATPSSVTPDLAKVLSVLGPEAGGPVLAQAATAKPKLVPAFDKVKGEDTFVTEKDIFDNPGRYARTNPELGELDMAAKRAAIDASRASASSQRVRTDIARQQLDLAQRKFEAGSVQPEGFAEKSAEERAWNVVNRVKSMSETNRKLLSPMQKATYNAARASLEKTKVDAQGNRVQGYVLNGYPPQFGTVPTPAPEQVPELSGPPQAATVPTPAMPPQAAGGVMPQAISPAMAQEAPMVPPAPAQAPPAAALPIQQAPLGITSGEAARPVPRAEIAEMDDALQSVDKIKTIAGAVGDTGPVSGWLKRTAQRVGIGGENLLDFTAAVNPLRLAFQSAIKGTPSDKDQQIIDNMMPDVNDTAPELRAKMKRIIGDWVSSLDWKIARWEDQGYTVPDSFRQKRDELAASLGQFGGGSASDAGSTYLGEW